MYNTFFSALRCALWQESFKETISAQTFVHTLALAKDQVVINLVFDILKDARLEGKVDRTVIFKTVGQTEKIKNQNRNINNALCGFVQSSQEVGLEYFVVKGQTIGCLYANPLLRCSGDIDFLVPEMSPNLSKVFPNILFPEIMREKEFGFESNKIIYELHTRLIDFGCKKHQAIWESLIDEEWKKYFYVEINGVKVRTLSPTINAVYLFLHLYFHLIREGVSIRQFCDWAIMLHYYRDMIDRTQLAAILQQLDMINGYKAFGCVLVDELGLASEDFPLFLAEEDRQFKAKIYDDIFKGGNFGKHNHKAKSPFGFKMETLRMAIRNSIRYYHLAPSEMRMMIPKMIRINLRLLLG